jgi:FkbM family methyltransferase
MRIKFNKEVEFIIKRFFLPEKYLLKKRLKRAIKNNYENELIILEKIINKNLDSVDVGVYRGVYSYKLSQISKHVHAFEPNPLIYPYLKKNLKKIINNISLYNIAASDCKGIASLKIPNRFNTLNKNDYEEMYKLGASTIHKKNKLNNEAYISKEVGKNKLDNVLKNKKIGFIKIDVEGHEKNVIIGASKIIKKNKPVLLVEIEEKHTQNKVVNIINFINTFGYKSYFLDKKELIEIKKNTNFGLKNNFIFLPL